MPGFIMYRKGASTEGPNSIPIMANNEDWLRSHRFRMIDFFGQMINNNHKQEFMALKNVVMPDKKIKELPIQTPGTTYKFAQQASYSDLTLSFYGSKTLLAKCLQMADKVHNSRDGIGDYQDYKGQVVFEVYESPDYDAMEYVYRNAWISEVKHGQVSYASSEIMVIHTTIKFDYFDVALKQKGEFRSIVNNNVNSPPEDMLGTYNGENSR